MSDLNSGALGSGDVHVGLTVAASVLTPPTRVTTLTGQWVIDNFLPGLPLEDSLGRPMSATLINGRIKAAVATFQRRYSMRLAPTVIKCGSAPMRNDPPDVDEVHAGFDYHGDGNHDHRQHIMRMPVGPIREMHALGLYLPGLKEPASLPVDWLSFRARSNAVRLFPRQTLSAAIAYTGGYFLNIHMLGRPVPEGWHITYTAGYDESALLSSEYDVLEALGKMVAIELLVPGSMDTFLSEGIGGKSISVDGLSQSIQLLHSANTLKYTNLITRMTEELTAWEATYWARRGGVRFSVL